MRKPTHPTERTTTNAAALEGQWYETPQKATRVVYNTASVTGQLIRNEGEVRLLILLLSVVVAVVFCCK